MTQFDICFLDRATIGPGVDMPRPRTPHHWVEYDASDESEIVTRASHCEVIISNKVRLDHDTLKALPKLKLVAIAATGFNNVDLDAAHALDITVCNVRGYALDTVPEHVFAALLALRRNLFQYREELQQDAWMASGRFCFFNQPIHNLRGSMLGIVGCGSLGQATARLAEAFGMRVQYLDQHASRAPAGARKVDFDAFLATSDAISLHCPLTDETRGQFNLAAMKKMKPTAILINTARGGIVNESDLVTAIEQGMIGGAAIDVLEQEPAALSHPLVQLAKRTNVLLTPHIAWASTQAMQALCHQLMDNIDAFANGNPRNIL